VGRVALPSLPDATFLTATDLPLPKLILFAPSVTSPVIDIAVLLVAGSFSAAEAAVTRESKRETLQRTKNRIGKHRQTGAKFCPINSVIFVKNYQN
jgi:hypothetical protein